MSCQCNHCKAACDGQNDDLKKLSSWLANRVKGDHSATTTRSMLKRKLVKMGIIENAY